MRLGESISRKKSIFAPIETGSLELSNSLVMAPIANHSAPMTVELTEVTTEYFP